MKFDVIQTPGAFEDLADEWNDLLEDSASHVPFLRHEYLKVWWQTLGGGEWDHGDLYIVTARNPAGKLAGIAPLFFTQNRDAEPALMLLGSHEISDYLDLIARPEDLLTFVSGLLELLSSNQAPPWKVLDWYNLLDSSPALACFPEAARRCGWSYHQEVLQHCPIIPLPGDWETYLAGIDKKQRHEVRRKMRRAEENSEPVRWYLVEDDSRLDADIDDFLHLMAQDPEKASFLTTEMRSQMRLAIHASFQAGWLQLAFLEVGGKKAAGYLNFDYAGKIWVYNSGIDFNYREISPGWVLLGYLLKWANENGRHAFDFMRGDEEYKYRFGAQDRRVMRAVIRR
jgi:CelD/BcsL family acetyltransferase involved in cellulose biosynthesis